MMMPETVSSGSASVSVSISTVSHSEEVSTDNPSSSSDDGISAYINQDESVVSRETTTTTKMAEFTSLKNAIKLISLEAIKAEEIYKAENQLLGKANEQLMKFSRLLQEQDAELAATEEALSKERKQRESAEKHFIKLKKMMVVKDVEVSEAEQRKKSEISLRKGAEKEMTLLRRQLQAKETQLASAERKYQKECKKREKFESQMMEISRQAGKQSAEEKYRMLVNLRETDDEEVKVTSTQSTMSGSKESSLPTGRSYERWKQRESDEREIANSLMSAQLSDLQDQLKQAEEEAKKATERFNRERQLREEADKQLIVMREKGFAYHLDRRSSARAHAEDALNSERLKLRNADLQEQYELLKAEAKKTLEKARDRVNEEKQARETLEEQLAVNRRQFEEALDREKEDHKGKMEDLAYKVKEATEEIERARASTSGTEKELVDLRRKYADYQQQVIEAKADSKTQNTLRAELQDEMTAMEDELDSMEAELKEARLALQNAENNYRQELQSKESELKDTQLKLQRAESMYRQELEERAADEMTKLQGTHQALQKAEGLYQEECRQRVEKEKTIEDLQKEAAEAENTIEELRSELREAEETIRELRSAVSNAEKTTEELRTLVAEGNLSLLEAKEKIKMLEEELQEAGNRCRLLKEKHQEEQDSKEKSDEEVCKKVRALEKDFQASEARCKLLKEKLQKEQTAKEESEESVFKLTQNVKQLTTELADANSRRSKAQSHREESEKECVALREKIDSMTLNFQKAITQGESSEQKLQDQVTALKLELEETKEKLASLQQSLEQAELQCAKEKELRQEAEANMSMEDRSLARKRREESEQEMINMEAHFQAVHLSEERWRTEKQQREKAEEQCRSLREEIYHMKHEQVMSSQLHSSTTANAGDQEAMTKLKEELELAESRRRLIKETMEEERRRREDLEHQNQAFRDMIPEYAAAEERYQKERRLRSEAETTIEALRQKLMGNKFWDRTSNQDESTVATVDLHAQQQVADLQSELASVRSQCEKAQAELNLAHERYEKEHHLRTDVEGQLESIRNNRATHSRSGNYDVERKMREKAEKQVMSMRLRMEAKETEIASLKSRLTNDSIASSTVSTASSRQRRRRSAGTMSPPPMSPPPMSPPMNPMSPPRPSTGSKQHEYSPVLSPVPTPSKHLEYPSSVSSARALPSKQLEYRASGRSMRTYDDQSLEIHAQEEEQLRDQIMETLPDYVKNNFRRIGFVKHSAFDYWPALVLDPFTVPLSIRTKWLELYYEFDKRDMFLVYLYGRRHRESVNAYPIVEPHHFISYEEGVERNLDQLPALIEDKIRYGDNMAEIEEEYSEGLTQIRIDARQHPRSRTHPLDESRLAGRAIMGSNQPSMTSSTSNSSSNDRLSSDRMSSDRMSKDRRSSSPKRARSEYSKEG